MAVWGNAPLETDRWYHVAGTYDGNVLELYLDGDSLGSVTAGSLQVGNSLPLYFSFNDHPGALYFLDGQLDDVAIWDYARTETEIEATMAGNVLTGTETGLIGYWDFEEDLDLPIVLDSTPNSNHGFLGSTIAAEDSDPTRIPEPSTLILLGIGAVGLLIYAWRKRRS